MDDFFVMHTEKIITMTEVRDKSVIKLYNRYLEDDDEENGEHSRNE